MTKTILITGSTDGIGLVTARALAAAGHAVVLHGRNPSKLADAERAVAEVAAEPVSTILADLSTLVEVDAMATEVLDAHPTLEVLINNAGVFGAPDPITADGLDVRFAVNTIAPYLITRRLRSRLGRSGRVINLSSAAQAPVDLDALAGKARLPDRAAYAQSKLALTMWSRALGQDADPGPSMIAVNPGSLLATKMVRDAFGVPGGDVRKGADVLVRAAISDEFADASGHYFDNDAGRFADPHPDALDPEKVGDVVRVIEAILTDGVRHLAPTPEGHDG